MSAEAQWEKRGNISHPQLSVVDDSPSMFGVIWVGVKDIVMQKEVSNL